MSQHMSLQVTRLRKPLGADFTAERSFACVSERVTFQVT